MFQSAQPLVEARQLSESGPMDDPTVALAVVVSGVLVGLVALFTLVVCCVRNGFVYEGSAEVKPVGLPVSNE